MKKKEQKLSEREQKKAFIIPLYNKQYSIGEIIMLTGISGEEVEQIIGELEEDSEENEWIIENLTATLAEIEKLWSSEADCEKKNT